MKKILGFIVLCLGLSACGGGGGDSSGKTIPQPRPIEKLLAPIYHTTADHVTGEIINGNEVADARPFASLPIITISFINPYTNLDITGLYVGVNQETSPDFTEFYFKGYDFFTSLESGGSCAQINRNNPLHPGQSCTAKLRLDIFNYTESEMFSIHAPWGYEIPDGPRFSGYQLVYSGPLSGLPEFQISFRTGSWYQGRLGYDFNGKNQRIMLVNQVDGVDYVYLSSGEKIKVDFDESGIALLDFAHNVIPCDNKGCQDGKVPYNMYIMNPYTGQIFEATDGKIVINPFIIGLNQLIYRRYINGGIPNVHLLYAVQPDGTIFGHSMSGEWGCFDNDGSNFRPLSNQPANTTFDYSNTSSANYVMLGQTNWVLVEEGGGGHGNIAAQNFYKLKADNTGECSLDYSNILNERQVQLNSQWEHRGLPVGADETLQVTSHGVYSLNISREPLKSIFMFYKYPPRE